MKAFINLIQDIGKAETKWIVWQVCLLAVNFGGGFFFFATLEGKLAVIFMVISLILMTYIHHKFGLSKLLAASNILWLYLVPHVLSLYLDLKPSHFRGWLFMVAIFNGLSLILSLRDLYKYSKGDKDVLRKV